MLSFVPLRNPVGFGAVDFLELVIAALLVGMAFYRKPFRTHRTLWWMAAFGVLPILLRYILTVYHPIPSPDIYDEFGHLLVADTLRHWRLANPPHALPQFFETFFVLQRPTYSSIYPIGTGLVLTLGWTGVLLCSGLFCALCYWMLLGWVSPGWATVGGFLAVFQFGPLNQWTNNYWGGGLPALAGCLVFGALPRRNGWLLGLGIALHLLCRPYESVFLVLAVLLYFLRPVPWRIYIAAALVVLPALGLTLLQNKRVTGDWMTLPYQLSQRQYGVPAPLTIQNSLHPTGPLTREQELDYRMQKAFHPGRDTVSSYLSRLVFRVRYYRFYFYPPLYLALIAFMVGIRSYQWAWVALTCAIFAFGVNFFPAFQFHYVAAVVCLFVLMSVKGLERISTLRYGPEATRALVSLCVLQFVFWYGLHVADAADFSRRLRGYDVWNSINHQGPERRLEVAREIEGISGNLLVFVQYWPSHQFQEEWVYNGADIDGQRVVWARDLGEPENRKLIEYYKNRKALLLEPDARPPRLTEYTAGPVLPEQVMVQQAITSQPAETKTPAKKPLLELEQVR
jgi:hypothetical protein